MQRKWASHFLPSSAYPGSQGQLKRLSKLSI
jgi:hypothetical protein